MTTMRTLIEHEIRAACGNRCEYCQLAERPDEFRHVLDHIIARQHGGQTTRENLALCCGRCNQFKGPNIAGLDPESSALVPLFHPRRDVWHDHFRWEGAVLVGTSPIGRATVSVLAINLPIRIAARLALIEEGTLCLPGES